MKNLESLTFVAKQVFYLVVKLTAISDFSTLFWLRWTFTTKALNPCFCVIASNTISNTTKKKENDTFEKECTYQASFIVAVVTVGWSFSPLAGFGLRLVYF